MNKKINVLGIGGSIHDFSSCLLQEGRLENFIEDERILRKKHSFYPGVAYDLIKRNASDLCIEEAGLVYEDIDLVVGNDILSKFYYHKIKSKVKHFELINHHLSHMCSSFYPSDFDEAAILTIDGGGNDVEEQSSEDIMPLEVCLLGYGSGNTIKTLEVQLGKRYPAKPFDNKVDPVVNSIGGFYGALTYACGFNFHEEGKTMGLAPYGTDCLEKEIIQYVHFREKGVFEFSIEGIRALVELRKLWEKEMEPDKKFKICADIAYAGQKITELAVIHAASHLKDITGLDSICIAGGVALNSVANYKLYKTGLFKNYFIQPAAGDNGTSIGSAYYGWHVVLGEQRIINNL